jgi:hypothetical protein
VSKEQMVASAARKKAKEDYEHAMSSQHEMIADSKAKLAEQRFDI